MINIINSMNIRVDFCNSTQLNSDINSFKILASLFDALKIDCIYLNARNYLNYAFNFEIISRNKNLKSNYYGFLFNKINLV